MAPADIPGLPASVATHRHGDADTIQRRLALFGKTVSLIALGFFVVGGLMDALWVRQPIERLWSPARAAHLSGGLAMGILWLACARGAWSPRALDALEVGSLLVSCTAWAFMLSEGHAELLGDVLLALTLTIAVRAIVVPSTARRTLWLSALASLPTPVTMLVFLTAPPIGALSADSARLFYVITTTMWVAAALATATVASHVIYGLRREVAAARDIGQYTLEEKLGSGGMGEVWRARHRLLIRPAALKLVRPEALGSSPAGPDVLLRRFEREARATAGLRSPHTVQLYDFGVTDDGTLYYAMELLEGVDLETLVRRFGPVPAERAVHILRQACRSLAEAHAAGLVHRDIKPANLFIVRAGGERDFIKVLDFGLVKLGETRADPESVKLTLTGAVAGTPAYIAPEMVLGEDHVDARADLYSLGCVGYWLLTGQLVFDADTAMKMMLAHAHTPPRPPSSRTELAIPAALDEAILACLAKDPADRPQTADDLIARLDACAFAAPWTPERAEKWWRAHLPEAAPRRPLADVLLSQEVRPRVVNVRPRRSRIRP
jgi:serine/threonine-protein kinase